ncbi:class I SAM-dependent methyltransferase [Arcobacter cloacae]|nr:methyltransferase domain-containing protein [Arcobacter cloacae]QKF90203.1 SAM-dependent methyltransferase [Arcobacter cloacae]
MKVRDSGMPQKDYWNSFFDSKKLIDRLFCNKIIDENITEFGSGYGTFTIPASSYTTKNFYALDIEEDLIKELQSEAINLNIKNIICKKIDFLENGTSLDDNSQGHVMVYNLLHLENPQKLLKEAFRILKDDGIISIIHWRSDIKTPRGPSLDIRPKPQDCERWLKEISFKEIKHMEFQDIAPYHYGIIAKK